MVDYIKQIQKGGMVEITNLEELFEFTYQLKESINYPTRKKVVDKIEGLCLLQQFKISTQTVRESNILVEEFEKIINSLCKR
jgi:hypothetical protein